VSLEDIHHSELLIIMGQNPGTNHPRMLSALEKCKKNGGKIIAINPLPEAGLMYFIDPQSPGKILTGGTPLADLFVQVRVNGDVALLKAIMLILLEEEKKNPGRVFDLNYIKENTYGYDAFIEHLQSQSFAECVAASGVKESVIREAADLIIQKEKIIICWAMGLDTTCECRRQHPRDREPVAAERVVSGNPVQAPVLFAATAMCRATARWASGRNHRNIFSISWNRYSVSIHRAKKDTIR
jgi:predicted molibdopterin-dependent oxidoreductase YjgC